MSGRAGSDAWGGRGGDGSSSSLPQRNPATRCLSVIVEGLGTGTTKEALREHFADCGRILLVELKPGTGSALVKFSTEEAARRAAQSKNVSALQDSRIAVSVDAAFGGPRVFGGRPGRLEHGLDEAGPGRSAEPLRRWPVLVSGLSAETTSVGLRAYFEEVGPVLRCLVFTDPATGRSTERAKVFFVSEHGQHAALAELDSSEFLGRCLCVRPAQAAEGPGLGGGFCATGTPRIRRKFDPDDGIAYTFEELMAKHTGRLSREGIRDVWLFDCLSAPDAPPEALLLGAPAPAEEWRADPEDGCACTCSELLLRARAEGYSDSEIAEHWDQECLPATAFPAASAPGAQSHGPHERRVDPEDLEACSFDELEAKLSLDLGALEIQRYWLEECAALPKMMPEASARGGQLRPPAQARLPAPPAPPAPPAQGS
mmetsp:Transcript_69921/g.182014  ORF Transcript_69921/g.182014 Transcript_69921/m.182014 type:complete len:428 (-) Transcript_69921:11-1294(-)